MKKTTLLHLLTVIVLFIAIFATQSMAETTKQKRERLKEQTSRQEKPFEPGKSCVGIKYGGIKSTHLTVRNVKWDSVASEGTWSGSLYFDARVAPKWYLGGALDIISGEVFSRKSNTLVDVSAHMKFNPLRQSRVNILPAVALGYAMLPEKNNVPHTNFLSKKLYIEFRYRLTPRLGIVADLGKWWVNGSNEFADVTGDCVYRRLGLIFF